MSAFWGATRICSTTDLGARQTARARGWLGLEVKGEVRGCDLVALGAIERGLYGLTSSDCVALVTWADTFPPGDERGFGGGPNF
jgi:hypothetical protein